MANLPIYLDNNATTPCDPRVVEAMLPYFTQHFGNAASRNHIFGWQAEEAVDIAREQVAKLIGADPKEIIFTSGATEADNLAIKGVFDIYTSKGNHIITVNTEHKAVLDTCKQIEKKGGEVTYLQVKADGSINLEELEAAIRPTTILIAIMYANNEMGVIHPVKAISDITRKHGVLFFTDGVQAVGKVAVDVNKDGIDLMAFTSHKMYGPKGVGALYIRRKNPRVQVMAQIYGGGHERGMRSGTLNVPGITGFGKAAELAMLEMNAEAKRLGTLRNKLEKALLLMEESSVNGNIDNRLPHVSSICFKHVEGEGLMMGINKTIAVSSGSACTSASQEPSYVLKALGLTDDMARSSIRFGLGRFTSEADIDYAIEKISTIVADLRKVSPLWEMNKEKASI